MGWFAGFYQFMPRLGEVTRDWEHVGRCMYMLHVSMQTGVCGGGGRVGGLLRAVQGSLLLHIWALYQAFN